MTAQACAVSDRGMHSRLGERCAVMTPQAQGRAFRPQAVVLVRGMWFMTAGAVPRIHGSMPVGLAHSSLDLLVTRIAKLSPGQPSLGLIVRSMRIVAGQATALRLRTMGFPPFVHDLIPMAALALHRSGFKGRGARPHRRLMA